MERPLLGGFLAHVGINSYRRRNRKYGRLPVTNKEKLKAVEDAINTKPYIGQLYDEVGMWVDSHYDAIEEALNFRKNALELAEDDAGWRPIETAPRDGTAFLAIIKSRSFEDDFWQDVVHFNDEDECFYSGAIKLLSTVTHWQPLPKPPAALLKMMEGKDV